MVLQTSDLMFPSPITPPVMIVPERVEPLLVMEKNIAVDPVSLRESSRGEDMSFPPPLDMPPILFPASPSFLSSKNLSNSMPSSPRFGLPLLKKKWKNESQVSPRQIDKLAHRHSSAVHPHLPPSQRESRLKRSQSCAEGNLSAIPVDELDLWFQCPSATKEDYIKLPDTKSIFIAGTENKTDKRKTTNIKKGVDDSPTTEDEFKCGALCMYLPGFGKGKFIKERKEETEHEPIRDVVLSRTVSLEKFECGSWASSAVINEHDNETIGDSMSTRYFDLPLELIRGNVNDTTTQPITSAFVFDKDCTKKGVLKNNGSARASTSTQASRKSVDQFSSRHVRFSTSSPTTSYPSSPASCITPRLRKAREEFNAFLEAQSA